MASERDINDMLVDDPPDLPEHQIVFDDILDCYNDGIEPLENWQTADLVRLDNAISAELQRRASDGQRA